MNDKPDHSIRHVEDSLDRLDKALDRRNRQLSIILVLAIVLLIVSTLCAVVI